VHAGIEAIDALIQTDPSVRALVQRLDEKAHARAGMGRMCPGTR
jgi:hypothetical protein